AAALPPASASPADPPAPGDPALAVSAVPSTDVEVPAGIAPRAVPTGGSPRRSATPADGTAALSPPAAAPGSFGVADPATLGVALPAAVVPGPSLPGAADVAAPRRRASQTALWLGLAVVGGLVLVLLVTGLVLVAYNWGREAERQVEQRERAQPVPPAAAPEVPAAASGQRRLLVNASVPGATIYLGTERLGVGSVDLGHRDLRTNQKPLIVVAARHDPVVVEAEELRSRWESGADELPLGLVPNPAPARPVYVESSRSGIAYAQPGAPPLGRVPGLVVVPARRPALWVDCGGQDVQRVLLRPCRDGELCVLRIGEAG
ncbi:MAG: hypothetical protein ACFCGT_20545, partial [Sandaracinaceae bacterium]